MEGGESPNISFTMSPTSLITMKNVQTAHNVSSLTNEDGEF